MDVIITPNKLSGSVVIPPSKSLSHRAIIAASLANGKSKISNVMYSKDINIEVSMIGKGYFSITKGRWKKYSIDITNKNAKSTTVQTYSFQEK